MDEMSKEFKEAKEENKKVVISLEKQLKQS